MRDSGRRRGDGQPAEPPGGKCSPRRGRRFLTVVQAAVERWAAGRTAGREMQPEAWAAFPKQADGVAFRCCGRKAEQHAGVNIQR